MTLLWLSVLALSSASWAVPPREPLMVSPDDFFCREMPMRVPDIIQVSAAECMGIPKEPKAMCLEYGYCVYWPKTLRSVKVKRAADGRMVPFDVLSPEEQSLHLISSLPQTAWLPSQLQCEKKTPPSSLECPAINECNGDLGYRLSPGAYSPPKHYQYSTTNPAFAPAFEQKPGDSAL